jgi:hypothetical protein
MTLRIPAARCGGIAATAAIVCLPLLLAGCAPARPAAAFGAATRAVLALQVADPGAAAAARNPAVAGVDGRAAGQAQGRYQKSFAEPQPQPSGFTIGVSGGK